MVGIKQGSALKIIFEGPPQRSTITVKQICIDSKILIGIILVFGFKEGSKELMLALLKLTWRCKFYTQVSFNKVNMSSLRLWPRYRGVRAGRLVQEIANFAVLK